MTDETAIEQVRKQLDQGYPETWRFDEDGREVIGYAVRKETGQTTNGPCDILVLNVNGELRSIWLMHTALINKLHELRPKAGDLIGIRQLGERQPKSQGGRPYMDYNVVVHGVGGHELTWSETPQLPQGEFVDAEPVEPAEEYSSW